MPNMTRLIYLYRHPWRRILIISSISCSSSTFTVVIVTTRVESLLECYEASVMVSSLKEAFLKYPILFRCKNAVSRFLAPERSSVT